MLSSPDNALSTVESAIKILNDLGKETSFGASQVALVVKNLPANAGDLRDVASIPGSGRSPGGGHGNPFQYSSLENPMDRSVAGYVRSIVSKSRTRLKQLSTTAALSLRFVAKLLLVQVSQILSVPKSILLLL